MWRIKMDHNFLSAYFLPVDMITGRTVIEQSQTHRGKLFDVQFKPTASKKTGWCWWHVSV